MKIVIIGKHRVELFDSIEEMPITRYQEYNKYLLLESGIGSTPEDIDRNMDKLANYINANDQQNGIKQLMILKQGLYFVLNGQSPKLMSFACLINSIDNNPVIDLSPEGLTRVLDKFKNKLTVKVANTILEEVKKN